MEDVMMGRFDFTPLYRSTIGFERIADMLEASRPETAATWPPYNIEKLSDDDYRITMAVAGFGPEEIEVVQQDSKLFVAGRKAADEAGTNYLYRGIGAHQFGQTFNLADHVKVTSATLENGLLTIALQREVPEELKPRKIAIGGAASGPTTISAGGDQQTIGRHKPKAA
jgi:molecular chaperone IbpA